MRLYFVRHGESEANVANQFSNKQDEIHPLTPKGRQQAQVLADKLRDIKFAAMYASPILRARQTAEIINAPHGLEIKISPAIREHDAGDLEGRSDPAAWQEYQALFETWLVKHDLDASIPNGESYNQLRRRFAVFVSDIIQTFGETDANVIVVAHAGVLHAMLPLFLSNVGYAFGATHILGNTAVVLTEQRQGALVCLEWDNVKLSPTGSILDE